MTTVSTIGRITKDFELRTSEKSGCIYANFSLAVNEGFGDNQKTTFFECTVFGADAERLIKAKAKRGSLLQITGKLGTSEFTRRNGEQGYSLTITVLAWSYIPGTNGGNGGGNSQAREANQQGAPDGSFIDTVNLDNEYDDYSPL
ncbi:MAG: single-stranded DNA-binding protein [Defluviitaleaceae bacterium]|nr:single-stranded DNA-binding protein [Defluviitaleaceae bacterium]